jgi:OFA family oxalate/formate antiporter-like MFS transporter
MLYHGAVVGGIGAGAVYGACVGNALKWFPDRRGLAAGITAMGFGAGSALTVFPIANMIRSQGYEAAFFKFGIAQGAVVFLVSWLLRAPDPEFTKSRATPMRGTAAVRKREFTPLEMLRTPAFWVMFFMFVLTAVGGLIATAQLTPIAKDLGVADSKISIFGATMVALPFALSMNRIFNGVSRPFFGWMSDHMGREPTMGIAFTLEGIAIILLSRFGTSPMAFVVLTALVFFAYGEIYSLFPAICGDAYGRKFASANAGLLYVAKGVASLLVPLASLISASGMGWSGIFGAAALMNFVAALLAIFVLRPLRTRADRSIAA